jgi:hypothetical protein
MFGELMTRIEKLKTRSDGGRSKKGREARKEESVTGLMMILTVVVGSVHIGERGMRIGQEGDIFDHIGVLSI